MNRKNTVKTLIIMIIISVIVIINQVEVLAYTKNMNFRNITNEDGLSQATVETIIQDKQGYIWIGTNDGLNRYNGYDFKVFRHDEDIKNTITNNYIVDLQEDHYGNIWVGTANGLSKINPIDESITNYLSSKENGNLSHYNIGDILVTKEGYVLVGTSDGLNLYNKEKDEFERILSKNEDLTNQYIYTLAEDGNGDIWISTKNGLNKVDIKNNKIHHFYSDDKENTISENAVYGLKYGNDGHMWAGTFKEGLNKIDINTHKITRYSNNPQDKNSLPGNFVRDILRDSSNNLWIATNEGLAKYNEEDNDFITYKNKIYDKTSIAEDEVFSIIEDNSGLIWVGTYAGISVFDPDNRIEHYKKDPFNMNSLNDNLIHGIHEDKDGLLWVGTNSKGINLIDRKNDIVKHITKENTNGSLVNDSINDITGKDNKIFIGTNNGLNIVDKDKKSIVLYNEDNGLVTNNIKTLFLDSKGYLWIGTPEGVNILNLETNEVIDITQKLKRNFIFDTYNRALYEDRDGVYWIGCFIDGGLIKIDPHNNTIKNYKYDSSNKKTISSNIIRSIIEDKYGNLWIGTGYGLNKFNKETEEFTRYTSRDGLPNNTVYGVLIDSDNNPWVSTNSGISKLDRISNRFENFGITDGLQGNEFNGNAYYKNNEGEFFFGGINGLNIFNPKEIKKTTYCPKVRFDEFDVKGKKYKNIDGLEFKHDENFINIEVFLPDYKNTKNVQYYYKLDGANSKWSFIDTNDINYSNLSPGKYTFRIKARGHNGVMSDESVVRFTIKPPFWLSKYAYLIYMILFILVIYLSINRMKRLDKLVKKKTEELSLEMEKSNILLNKVIKLERNKNSYLINLSHELRTPLNVIYTTEQLITELNKSEKGIEKEKLNQYMEVVRRNAKRLLALINNLIDTTKIESGRYQINLQDNNIVYVVEEATLSLKEYIENKGIELIIDPEIEEKIIKCDSYEIERCIVNLVSNAAKFTPKGGQIIVTIKELKDKVMITVEDTGIGIDKKYHEKIFDRFNQIVDVNSEVKGGSGLGLTITKHIIDLHHGKIFVESELNKGTKFTIIL